LAYRTPFISGKDSLNNQFTTDDGRTIRIPPTLLISGFGIVDDVHRCVTMDAKTSGSSLVLVGETTGAMGGSQFADLYPVSGQDRTLPEIDLDTGPRTARAVAAAIAAGLVRSAHDCSEGGVLVAAAEMAFAGGLGLAVELESVHPDPLVAAFAETPGRYLLEVRDEDVSALEDALGAAVCRVIGRFDDRGRFACNGCDASVDELRDLWSGTINW
ncbi:MAG TPA: phosphoribosylformylglycinamidine synthase subunit PurL, partial [Phycisphaerales bacterium]|nr:phosphoribosylformylglycinamidine synthase subunit PurL [Phycisphaerales bacterium]